MRLYQTYLVRLLIDTDPLNPELRGSLQIIGDQRTYSFKSGLALLSLLKGFNQANVEGHPANQPSDQEHRS